MHVLSRSHHKSTISLKILVSWEGQCVSLEIHFVWNITVPMFLHFTVFSLLFFYVLLFSLSTVINFFSFCVSSFLLYCTMFTFCKMFFLIFPALFMFIKFMDTLKGQISQQIILIIRCCTYKQANINFEYNHWFYRYYLKPILSAPTEETCDLTSLFDLDGMYLIILFFMQLHVNLPLTTLKAN